MNSKIGANVLIIFIIAIIAVSVSIVFASLTEDYIDLDSINLEDSETKMLTVGDENFTPIKIKKIITINTTVNNTTSDDNNSFVNNITDGINNIFSSEEENKLNFSV